MKRSFFLLFCLLIASTSLFAQSPGGVSGNLRWWLKANAGTFTDDGITPATDNQAVQQWNDQSTILNHTRQATLGNKPIYRTNIINGNPVLRFSSDQFIDGLAAPGVGPTESLYVFLVFKQNSYVPGGTADGNGTFIIDRTTATNNLASFKIVNTDKYFYQKRNDSGGSLTGPVSVASAPTNTFTVVDYFRNVGTNYGIYIDGRLDATSGGDSEAITAPVLRIGRHATTTNGGLNGDLAEMILYNSTLSGSERQRIESYLALKYGVTLNQNTPTSYLNSAGSVVYPAATTHDAYDNDIAGIALDNGSALNQTGSQSQNALSMVRIFSPSSLDDGDFLVWGHNAPTIWNSTQVPSPYVNRLTRIWRVAETGETGTFSISFDLSGLGISMSNPALFALLTDADGNFSDATAHTTGRSISGNVVTFTGASIDNNQYFTLACPLIPGPGGVAATTVWLRADEDVYNNAGVTLATNNQTVQQWNTRGGLTAANALQGTSGNRPTFLTNIMNGNPVVRFANTHFLDFGTLGISTTSDLNMTAVVRPATLNGGTLTNATGGYIVDRTTNTTPVFSLKLLSTNKAGLQERIDSNPPFDGPVTTTNISTTAPQIVSFYRDYTVRFGIHYNSQLENILTEAGGALTFPIPRIGASQAGNNGLNGDIAEFIFYNRDISAGERNRIDSYLAIKYGITLNQVTLTDYTASNGTVIYPATAASHSGFVSDIAGIGRDAISRLNQSNSQSVNTNSVVRMQSPSSLDDLDFLVWGSNGGSLTTPNTLDVDGVTIRRRLSRVWRVALTANPGTVTVSFDLSAVPGAKAQADLRLLIDRDGDGFSDNDVPVRTGTLVGSIFTVTTVTFQHGDRFTIGSTNATSTPLPVELIEFTAVYEKPGVVLSWKTASELNNDHFTVERSASGVYFEDIATVPGAGTTSEEHFYQHVDPSPFTGKTYYRLRQTDTDGTTAYSSVVWIETPDSKPSLSLFPNPNEGSTLNFRLGESNSRFQLLRFEVLTQQGVSMFSHAVDGHTDSAFSFELTQPLPRGFYIVKVHYNDTVESVKLVVH